MSGRKYSKEKTNSYHNYLLLPLIIVLGLIPLIVKLHPYYANLKDNTWYPINDLSTDYFLYYKSIVLIFTVTIMMLMLIFKIYKNKGKIEVSKIFIPLVIYAFLIILSTIFSESIYFSTHGIHEQFESVFVLLGYCLISFYTYVFVNSEDDIRYIIKWWIVGIIIICLIGLSQFISMDFLNSVIGKKLILGDYYSTLGNDLKATFGDKMVYMTLYNPNYVGLYTSLVTPVFMILALLTKNKKLQIGYMGITFALLLCMFGSGSRNAILAMGVSFLFILILFRKKIISIWKPILFGSMAIVLTFVIANSLNNNFMVNKLKDTFTTSSKVESSLKDIKTNNNNIEILYNDQILSIEMDSTKNEDKMFRFYDQDNKEISSDYDKDTFTYNLADERFSSISTTATYISDAVYKNENINNLLGFCVTIDGSQWFFTNQLNDGSYYYLNAYGRFDKINTVNTNLLKGYESFGSGRGFIWSRTIPLLKDHIIIGSGPDTFTLVYPHQDYVAAFNNGFGSELVTKPHNMYMQIGIQTGVLSLIAFLVFYFMYFIQSLKLFYNNKFDNYCSQIGAAFFVGTIGFMVSGLVNDSSITTTPVFWCLIGMGLATNKIIKQKL